MLNKKILFLPIFFAVVFPHPTEILDGSGAFDPDFDIVKNSSDDLKDEEFDYSRREEALTKLQQIFGIPEPIDRLKNRKKIPPQFMMELYNTIADPSGVTRGKNPYNAKVVRSFIERDNSMPHYYLFNISGLERNESVLEAELHLYRRRTPLKAMHPTVLSSPYYLIRVYQVLNEHQLDTPDLHRLLNVHYVGAYASGWQVFNVKQAVLSWVSGSPNLGLLVTASNLFGDDAAVHYSRRNDYHHSKQPILVLFDDDGKERKPGEITITPNYYKYTNNLEDEDQEEEEEEEEEEEKEEKKLVFNKSSDLNINESSMKREKRGTLTPGKKKLGIISKDQKITGALTSMDIYERAIIREKIFSKGIIKKNDHLNSSYFSSSSSSSDSVLKRRRSRSTPGTITNDDINATECTRHELYVDFDEIGWSNFIIAPSGYSAYHCKGHCNFPLSQSQHPTNHATVQSIVHMLRQGKDVSQPCCVPTKLLSSSLLYFDDGDNVVLKLYEDMVADRCGCH